MSGRLISKRIAQPPNENQQSLKRSPPRIAPFCPQTAAQGPATATCLQRVDLRRAACMRTARPAVLTRFDQLYDETADARPSVWDAPVATAAGPRRHLHAGSYVASLAFDAGGHLLASVTHSGRLAVHDCVALQFVAHRGRQAASSPLDRAPSVPLVTSLSAPVVHAYAEGAAAGLAWDPRNIDVVAVARGDALHVALFDLGYCAGSPTSCLREARRSHSR